MVSSPACGSLPPSSSLSAVAYVACREDRSAFVSTPTFRTDLPTEELLGEAGGGGRCRETANYSPDSLGLRVATRALSPRRPDKTLWPDDGSVSLKSPRAQSETPRAKTPKTPNTGELTALFDRAYENPAGDTLETRDFAELPSDNAGDASQRGRERECVDPNCNVGERTMDIRHVVVQRPFVQGSACPNEALGETLAYILDERTIDVRPVHHHRPPLPSRPQCPLVESFPDCIVGTEETFLPEHVKGVLGANIEEGFRVECVETTSDGSVPPEESNAWWADGPAPAWLRRLKGDAEDQTTAGSGTGSGDGCLDIQEQAKSDHSLPSAVEPDATIWLDRNPLQAAEKSEEDYDLHVPGLVADPCTSANMSNEDETSAWIANLRGSDDELDDPCFGKLPNRRKKVDRPPRPGAIKFEMSKVSDSKPTGSVGADALGKMPDALRKKLEQRGEQRARERKERPERNPQLASPRDVVSAPVIDEAVRLPPLEPESSRRCASQPPANPPRAARRKPRTQSIGVDKVDEEERCHRQMFDKNTLRTNHRDTFVTAIQQWRKEVNLETRQYEDEHAAVRVFVRKRPLFEKEERQRGDYDIISVLPGRPFSTRVVLHNCLFQADLKTPFIHHLTFDFDRVFGEGAESQDVYTSVASPLIQSSLDGGVSTLFMFGQTGSGKTFTMNDIHERAAKDLFLGADGQEPWVSVQFVELRGNRCFDLLANGVAEGRRSVRPEVRLREQKDGSYFAEGAVDLFPTTPEELCTAMHVAHSRRATSATDANAVSSRSHAVCTLRLMQSEGQLMFVDCAGTEWRKDSMWHSKERQQEGAEINASLHALKECIRYLTTQQSVPSHAYRMSSLTKILADAFIRGSCARLAVICTTSPCATDSEHTVGTLRVGMGLSGRGSEKEEKQLLFDCMRKKPRLVHPKQWTPEQVSEWIVSVNGGTFRGVLEAVPSNFTGQMLVRLTESRCVQLCGNERRGRQFFDLLHQEIQRVQHSHRSH